MTSNIRLTDLEPSHESLMNWLDIQQGYITELERSVIATTLAAYCVKTTNHTIYFTFTDNNFDLAVQYSSNDTA